MDLLEILPKLITVLVIHSIPYAFLKISLDALGPKILIIARQG